jgi:hypothetical protein
MSHLKTNQSNRKWASKHKSKPRGTGSDDVMADVMAQLRRQREKRKADDAAESSVVHPTSGADGNRVVVNAALNTCAPKSMGRFCYDPVLKRYLPKSAYKSNGNNDECIQRLQKESRKKMGAIDSKPISRASAANTRSSSGAVFDYDLRRVLFRGCCLRTESGSHVASHLYSTQVKVDKKRKKRSKQGTTKYSTKCLNTLEQKLCTHPCSERSIILLATSLSYCSSTRRRRVASVIGAIYIARGLEVVSCVATTQMLIEKNKIGCIIPDGEKRQRSNHQMIDNSRNSSVESKPAVFDSSTTWHSLLTPISTGLNSNQSLILQNCMAKQTIPLDCHCKSYLHPTTSTFDILSDGSSLPHVVTIIGERMMHYRKPVEPSSIDVGVQCADEPVFSIPNENAIVIEEE